MKPVLVIGITGGSCSGKTLVSKKITQQVGEDLVLTCNQDSYYRDLRDFSPKERADWNFDHPDAFDLDLFHVQMEALILGKTVQRPVYDFVNHIRTNDTVDISPRAVIIIEGILVLEDEYLRDMIDFKIYVDEDSDIRLARRIRRDEIERGRSTESVMDQYLRTVRPMHLRYIEPSKRHADLIIPGGGENERAIRVVSNHIKRELSEQPSA